MKQWDQWVALGIVTFVAGATFVAGVLWWQRAPEGLLRIAVADVGQGSLTIVTTPIGFHILVDAGPSESATLAALGRVDSRIRRFSVVVATHPDADHIGGLPAVLRSFPVGELWISPAQGEPFLMEQVRRIASEKGIPVRVITQPRLWRSPDGVVLAALYPDRPLASSTPTNTASIVVRLTYGEATFVATGDAPREVEHYLAGLYGMRLASDALLLGHHGSRTSTDEWWLNAIHPRFALISAGQGNPFGHPHKEVLQRLERFRVPWCLTARDGDIILLSDGSAFVLPSCLSQEARATHSPFHRGSLSEIPR